MVLRQRVTALRDTAVNPNFVTFTGLEVGNCGKTRFEVVGTSLISEHKCVGSATASENVSFIYTEKRVASENITAIATSEGVTTLTTYKFVITLAAAKGVIAIATSQLVLAIPIEDKIVASLTEDKIIDALGGDDVT